MKKKDINDGLIATDTEEEPGVDYAAEYKKQTGRDLETGEYVTQ